MVLNKPDKTLDRANGGLTVRAGERGIALVLVLWLTLVLSVTAVSVTRIARGDVRIAYNMQQAAEAQALADGGYYLAVAALKKARSEDPWPIDGTVREVVIAGALVTVSIRDEALKTDLNSATGEMLETALLSSGLDEQVASGIADAIVAERQRRSGSVPAQGLAGLLARPNQFFTIGELQTMAGLNRPDYQRLRDYFTVYSGRRARDGATGPNARRSLVSRLGATADGTQPRSTSNTYSIRSSVRLASGASFQRYAVVRLSAVGATRGPQVLHWD